MITFGLTTHFCPPRDSIVTSSLNLDQGLYLLVLYVVEISHNLLYIRIQRINKLRALTAGDIESLEYDLQLGELLLATLLLVGISFL